MDVRTEGTKGVKLWVETSSEVDAAKKKIKLFSSRFANYKKKISSFRSSGIRIFFHALAKVERRKKKRIKKKKKKKERETR